jgi:hypothetical protein
VLMLPAGEFVPTQEQPNAATSAEHDIFKIFMYHPGGFRVIDLKSVVSPLPVFEPETYPTKPRSAPTHESRSHPTAETLLEGFR